MSEGQVIALIAHVEISDQMGRDKAFFIGVFNLRDAVDGVKKFVEARTTRRIFWEEIEDVQVNMVKLGKDWIV